MFSFGCVSKWLSHNTWVVFFPGMMTWWLTVYQINAYLVHMHISYIHLPIFSKSLSYTLRHFKYTHYKLQRWQVQFTNLKNLKYWITVRDEKNLLCHLQIYTSPFNCYLCKTIYLGFTRKDKEPFLLIFMLILGYK